MASSVSSNDNCSNRQATSLLVSDGSIDEFDAIAFRKRLFSRKFNIKVDGTVSAIKCRDFWMSLQMNDVLLVEVGHAAMAGGKDQFVDLVEEQFEDSTTNQIIVYFSKHRSDFKQLVNSFEIMDFEAISTMAVTKEVGLDLNDSNYFMRLSTDYDSNSDDSDSSDDLIAFH